MKTIIVYYSFMGSTKKEAEHLSSELNVPLCQVKETHDRSLLAAFIPGAILAMRRKLVAIQPMGADLNDYDRIIIGCPVWGGYPAPPFNSIMEQLPAGKEVEIFLCSGSSGTKKSQEGTKALIKQRGCTVVSYRDIYTSGASKKRT